MDTDFTVRTIGYHKDTQEADKLVLPTLEGTEKVPIFKD